MNGHSRWKAKPLRPESFLTWATRARRSDYVAAERAFGVGLGHQQRREDRRVLDGHHGALRLERQHGMRGIADQADAALVPVVGLDRRAAAR